MNFRRSPPRLHLICCQDIKRFSGAAEFAGVFHENNGSNTVVTDGVGAEQAGFHVGVHGGACRMCAFVEGVQEGEGFCVAGDVLQLFALLVCFADDDAILNDDAAYRAFSL